MVKVLIDGKEYEGTQVKVEGFYGTSFSPNRFEVWDIKKPREPKQEFVSVPKEIQFYGRVHGGIKLLINNHFLEFLSDEEDWSFYPYDGLLTKGKVDCVLVPTKREDLKAGDWAFWDFEKEAYHIKDLSQYDLILNEKDSVHVLSFENKLIIEENKELLTEGINWFKVVPRSEVEK